MKGKNLGVLALAAAAALGIGFLVTRERSAPPAAAAGQGTLFADLAGKADAISKIEIRKGAQAVTVEKDASGAWSVTSKSGYPAEFDKVRSLLRGLANARVVEPKTSRPDMYARLGVQDPADANTASLVTLSDASGAAFKLIVGNRDTAGAPREATGEDAWPRWFVRRAGEAQALLIRADITLNTEASQWVNTRVVEVNNDRVKSAAIQHPAAEGATQGDRVAVSRPAATDTKYTMDWMPEGRTLKDEFAPFRVATSLSSITFDDVRPAAEVDLSAADAVVGEFRTFDGLVIRTRTRTVDGRKWTSFAAAQEPVEGQDPAAAENVKKEVEKFAAAWSPWVFAIADWKLQVMNSKVEDLLAPLPEKKDQPGAPGETPTPPDQQPSILIPGSGG